MPRRKTDELRKDPPGCCLEHSGVISQVENVSIFLFGKEGLREQLKELSDNIAINNVETERRLSILETSQKHNRWVYGILIGLQCSTFLTLLAVLAKEFFAK